MRTIAHVSALRPMRDSVNWAAIPVGTPLVAGYVPPSGFAWPTRAWTRFIGSTLIRITPSASVTGRGIQVLDVETGDATPGQAPGWALAQRRAGQEPTIYCAQNTWAAVQAAFTTASLTQPYYWVAAYPGDGAALPTLGGITAIAHQYADPVTSGGDWDQSVVADYWPGVDTGGPMSTTFDAPTVQSEYVNPTSQRSTAELTMAQYIVAIDAHTYQALQFLMGEWRIAMPDGTAAAPVARNVGDFMVDVTERLMTIENAIATIAGTVGTLAGAVQATQTAIATVTAKVEELSTPAVSGSFTITGAGTVGTVSPTT